jgi:hypothetical protein
VNRIELKQVFLSFAAATDEAKYLFDDNIAEYLSILNRRGLRLRAIGLVLEARERRTPELTQEQADLAFWLSEQFEEYPQATCALLAALMRLANTALPLTASLGAEAERGVIRTDDSSRPPSWP